MRPFQWDAWQGQRRQSLVVLLVALRSTPDLAMDTAWFWTLLAELSAHGTAPWPQGQSDDPWDPDWQWCFDGELWSAFVEGLAYQKPV